MSLHPVEGLKDEKDTSNGSPQRQAAFHLHSAEGYYVAFDA